MEMNITREALNVNKVVCEKKEIMNIQGDMIVPDSKPDILNTINTTGNICIYKKEILDGKIKIDGNILVYIMYLADNNESNSESNIRGLNTNIDFSETFNISELENGMDVDIIPYIKLIECKVINGRKIGIKATIEIGIKAYSIENVEIITNLNDNNIQALNKEVKVNSLLGKGATKASIKENISIPNTDNLAEILSTQINLVDKDIKISYNKVLAKSEIEIKIIYLTEEGQILSTKSRLPLVGFIDIQDVKEENICETTYNVKNIVIKPNSIEEHTIYVEIEVEISCITYEEKDVKMIQDMYCPSKKINFDEKMINTVSNKQCKKDICNIREKINVPELGNGTIISTQINTMVNKESKLNGKINIEGEMDMKLIFTDSSTVVGISTKNVTIPFNYSIDEVDTTENCNSEINIETNSQEIINKDGIVNTNVDLILETNTYRNLAIPVISNVTIDEPDELEDYSVIIYVVKSGDTLWKIAKSFGSTVDDIARVNGIQNQDKINVGEKIYIPKYVVKRESTLV